MRDIVDRDKILKAMPHWAPELERTMEETVSKMTPGEFVKKVQAESLRNLDLFLAMNPRQLGALGRGGTGEQKNAIRDSAAQNLSQIKAEIQRLNAIPGREKDAARISRTLLIAQGPDFR